MATERLGPTWLAENSMRTWETGLSLPLRISVGPVVQEPQTGDVGQKVGWYGSLTVLLFKTPVWECEHLHDTPGEAAQCASDELGRRTGD